LLCYPGVSKMNEITLIIADNQNFTKAGIVSILTGFYHHHLDIITVKNKAELNQALNTEEPQLLIIDYNLFDFELVSEFGEIRKNFPNMGILVISEVLESEEVLSIINLGITNYILKTSNEQELIDAVTATLNNRKYLSSQVLDLLLDWRSNPKPAPGEPGKLTTSEHEIVRLIAQGLTNKEIALQKKLSYHTIITHRKNIFRKLGISNSSELLMHAMRSGLIDTTEYYI
jgi:DNA-binding NarL/FixJ family response regulator